MGDPGMPVWKGLFEWSMKYQDGTQPSSAQRAMSEEDKRWLEDALKSYMVDLGQRMKAIKDSLEGHQLRPTTLEEKEMLLEELMELVEGIDQARDLHTIGGLSTLLELLESEHSSLRWRAAEVVATCVQNNPPVQKWFMEGGALPLLVALLADEDATCQTKGLLALSCLIRGCHPALLEFRNHDGAATLCTLLRGGNVRVQRKCLQLLRYMVRTVPADRLAVARGGALAAIPAVLASQDNDLRQAALALATELASEDEVLRVMQEDSALCESLRELQMRLDTLLPEDWEMVQEEVTALKALNEQLARELPPAPTLSHDLTASGSGRSETTVGARGAATVLFDNPEVSGASPEQLQLATVPSGSAGGGAAAAAAEPPAAGGAGLTGGEGI